MISNRYLNIHFYLIFCFLLFGNFYWYPFFDAVILLKYIKYALIFLFLFFFLLSFYNKKVNSSKDSFFIFIAFFLWVIYALFYYLIFSVSDVLLQVVLFFVFFSVGKYFKATKNYSKLLTIFFIVSLIMMILSSFMDFSFFKKDIEVGSSGLVTSLDLSSIGYGQSRTTWGVGITFTCFFLMWYFKEIGQKNIVYILFLLSFASIIVSGSRGAFIYFATYLLILIFKSAKTILSYFFMILLIPILPFLFIVVNNIDAFQRDSTDITSGRFEGFQYLEYLFQKNLLFGYEVEGGYSLEFYRDGYSHIHNAFVNYLLNYGIFNLLFLSTILIYIVYKSFRNIQSRFFLLYYMVFCGLASTFLEPDTIFSYGHHVLIFWFVIGILYANSSNINKYKNMDYYKYV